VLASVTMLRSVQLAKRAIDVAGALAGMAMTAPLMPVIAAAIYLDSPGPVFYRQRRAGRLEGVSTIEGGVRRMRFHEFTMHKFRTMRTDAEREAPAL
jgi:lipopolysaccharide/colanic/teichoic acid biosynthesis glycosyltransferase